jgi:hypothetical protein
MYHAEKIAEVMFPARNQAAEILQPGKSSFHFSAGKDEISNRVGRYPEALRRMAVERMRNCANVSALGTEFVSHDGVRFNERCEVSKRILSQGRGSPYATVVEFVSVKASNFSKAQ